MDVLRSVEIPPEGPVSGGGGQPSGGSPGRQVYKYGKIWRNTRMGGIDYAIAVCLFCREVVKPVSTRRSRSGTHGEDYFVHEHPLLFAELYQSNSGNRDYIIDGGLEFLEDLVDDLWIYYREDPGVVEEKIAEKLKGMQ